MCWIYYNANPYGRLTGDCVIRAISVSTGKSWNDIFEGLSRKAYQLKDMPSVNPIWAEYLLENGYSVYDLPDTCPRCYTVKDFAKEHRKGNYVLGTGNHAVTVIDGYYIDNWDCGDEVPKYMFKKGV